MNQTNVTMRVREVSNSVCVIDIHGEINAQAEPVLMNAYTTASASGARSILLNFSDLQYMNSSGIGLLVTLLIRARRQNQRLSAFAVNDHYRKIFELTRLDEAISIYASEADALAAAG